METKYCVVAVTGGASGLGEATVRELVEHGAKVSILDLDGQKGESLPQNWETASSSARLT